METTTLDYDFSNYSDDAAGLSSLCNRDEDNSVGAKLSVLYYFMFLFSVFGNGLVLVIIHRFEKLTTVTNILLLNLVLSSLIFMSSLPFMAAYMQLSTWVFGKLMCNLVGSVYYLGFYSSVLFLALLTFDRHLAVVYSVDAARLRSRGYAAASCAAVWIVSGLACVRPMILHTTFFYSLDDKIYCDEYPGDLPDVDASRLRTSGFYIQLFVFLVFPLVVIVYCYARISVTVLSSGIVAKFKTVRLILAIVVLFFLCWTPFNVVLLMDDTSCEESRRRGYALHVTRNLAYAYFCFSPVFYTFVGKKFQNYFRRMLATRFPRLRRHVDVSQNSRNNASTKTSPNYL